MRRFLHKQTVVSSDDEPVWPLGPHAGRMTSRVAFTAADIKRAMGVMEKCGHQVAAVDFPKEGGFRLVLGDRMEVAAAKASGRNEWDDVLPQ
ncbi:hypothetical protein [Brevundimonas vesicularis]|uniref:hypothetical protein n=1 Tax=Brevundimonas vesicularis TaxID=41276 RepID=UPI00384E6772